MNANQTAGYIVGASAVGEKTAKMQQRRFNIAPMMDRGDWAGFVFNFNLLMNLCKRRVVPPDVPFLTRIRSILD